MKIIDLLVKISKGEEVPKEIKIRGVVYKFTQISTRNLTFSDRGDNINYAYEDDFENYWLDCARINEEVEILEEEKEIEKLNQSAITLGMCRDKINELIDEINKLKRDKE